MSWPTNSSQKAGTRIRSPSTSTWFSAGSPTGLVRDGHIEGTDPPPDGDVPGPLVPEYAEADAPADGADLRRADEAEAEGTGSFNSADAVWDVMPEVFPLQ